MIEIPVIIEQIRNGIPNHLGYDNLLSQKDLDQGDTAQRVGTMFTLMEIADYHDTSNHPSPQKSYRLLSFRSAPGVYRRSPNPAFWGNRYDNLSRDQLSVLKTGMVATGQTKRLLWTMLAQTLRFGFHQNIRQGADENKGKIPDFITVGELSVYCRGLLGKASVIPNFFLDLALFVDLALRTDDNWDADNMLALNLLFANHRYPTIWSKLAMKLYLKTNFMDRLWNYHRDQDNNGCEPLYWLFRLAFAKQQGYNP